MILGYRFEFFDERFFVEPLAGGGAGAKPVSSIMVWDPY
jgi:hypothetical protein